MVANAGTGVTEGATAAHLIKRLDAQARQLSVIIQSVLDKNTSLIQEYRMQGLSSQQVQYLRFLQKSDLRQMKGAEVRRSSQACDVQGLEGLEPITVIVDDSATVWPGHGANLVQVERYCYFPNATRQFGYHRVSLLESGR